MAIEYGLKWEHQSAAADRPTILSYAEARSVADDPIFELWQGPTSGTRVFRVSQEGQLQAQDGLVSKPSYSFESDKDTGIYYASTEVRVAVGGADVLKVGASLVTSVQDVALGDDVQLRLGGAPDYWLWYDATGTALTLTSTDVDGGGSNGTVFSVQDGTDDVAFAGNLTADGQGPYSFGSGGGSPGATDNSFFKLTGTFTSGGSSTAAVALDVEVDLTGAAGDTTFLAQIVSGNNVGSSITTQGTGDTIADVATAILYEPDITVTGADVVTNATTLKVASAPDEGTNNRAFWVVSGTSTIGGALEHTGSTLGLFGATPASQPAAYTVSNGTTVRTYDADATTVAELADVLATLIGDLQSLGAVAT